VLLLGVRHRGTDDQRLLYGTLLMCNAGSLLLPGSNLTNLLVLSAQHQSVTGFARQMWPAFAAAVGVTIVVVVCSPRRHRGGGVLRGAAPAATFVTTRSGIGTAVVATTAALVCMLTLGDPAPAVAAIGALAVALEMARRRVTPARVVDAVDPAVLVGLFGIATALGVLGRSWHWPSSVLASANPGGTAAIAVGTSVALNNLPAAALLAARPVAHAHALLVGLDLGPNLAVTGSLSALLWYRTARAAGARPRVGHISKIGVILAPLSIAAALLALHFLSSGIV
jgi:arsenical pump membrane protein